jgi:hypothetical protein
VIRLIDDHNLESLLGALVYLLRLRNLLRQILYDDSVIGPNIRGRDLQVINRCYDVELEFPVGGGLEDSRIDLDLFDAGTIELFESSDNAGLLPRA